ncbi:MAG: hypothetical protein JRC93_03945 [Deltaproteobacteria bacterium]|nr:hypothetical protein [Deltaproteobacteria bacterium]
MGAWSIRTKVSKYTEWTEADRDAQLAKTMRYLNQLLIDAKKQHVNELVGVPVEIVFNDGMLSSWRILTEVV